MNRSSPCGCTHQVPCAEHRHSPPILVQIRPPDSHPANTSAVVARGQVFQVQGLDCHEEVALLEGAIGPLVGGASRLQFDLIQGEMSLPVDASVLPERILREISAVGLHGTLIGSPGQSLPQIETVPSRDNRLTLALISTAFIGAAWLVHLIATGDFPGSWHGLHGLSGITRTSVILLYLVGILAGCWKSLPLAWRALRHMQPDMHLLMTLAVTGAVFLQEWQEAAAVSCLFAWSLLLESWTIVHARRSLKKLLDTAPPQVRRLSSSGEESVPVESLNIGDVFRVLPGERIPLDGNVVRGSSEVNQSPVTGESIPVLKLVGSHVYGGTLNGNSVLEIESTDRWENSTVARIARLIQQGQAQKSRSEAWVERFARLYTPCVFAAALLVWLGFVVLGGRTAWDALPPALVLLVIACPCALVISTPVSVVSALACAARQGVLVKGGRILELPASIDLIALDKTGTLTTGYLQVSRIIPHSSLSEKELLTEAASLEQYSGHPLALSIVREARDRRISLSDVDQLEQNVGKGLSGFINGEFFQVGSADWLKQSGVEVSPSPEAVDQLVLGIARGSELRGWILCSQQVRPELPEVVSDLKQLGIRRIVMLTGDQIAGAASVAEQAGITDVRSGLTPDEKLREIETLERESSRLAMIGDGINDAPALARAPLGIAVQSVGGDVALETADISLLSDDLRRIPWLIRHSRRLLRTLHVNLTLALGVKFLFAFLALVGLGTMWGAVAADMGTTLLVTANALRLLKKRD